MLTTDHQLDSVLTLREAARICSVSVATLRRRIADGTGPAVVRPSARRIGIRASHLMAWLDRAANTKPCHEKTSPTRTGTNFEPNEAVTKYGGRHR
jgi:predicted DNA-binding transcriptional regulator AlpA